VSRLIELKHFLFQALNWRNKRSPGVTDFRYNKDGKFIYQNVIKYSQGEAQESRTMANSDRSI